MSATLSWLQVRVTQLEMERAQLLWNYTGVRVPTPEIKKTDLSPDTNPMTQIPNFNDVGDAAAAKLGISWAEDGTLQYAK